MAKTSAHEDNTEGKKGRKKQASITKNSEKPGLDRMKMIEKLE